MAHGIPFGVYIPFSQEPHSTSLPSWWSPVTGLTLPPSGGLTHPYPNTPHPRPYPHPPWLFFPWDLAKVMLGSPRLRRKRKKKKRLGGRERFEGGQSGFKFFQYIQEQNGKGTV